MLLLGCQKSQYYSKVAEVRDRYGNTISTEEAAYVLAADTRKVNLAAYLDGPTRERIMNIRSKAPMAAEPPRRAASTRVAASSPRDVTIKLPKLDVTDPFLPAKTVEQCRKMAEVYPLVYLFENSLRAFIDEVMQRRYGGNWWASKAPKKAVEQAEERKRKHGANAWHSSPHARDINYVDIDRLTLIIRSNSNDFSPLFDGLPSGIDWLLAKISHIELHRNTIAHNNPLTADNIQEVTLYFRQWQGQLKQLGPRVNSLSESSG